MVYCDFRDGRAVFEILHDCSLHFNNALSVAIALGNGIFSGTTSTFRFKMLPRFFQGYAYGDPWEEVEIADGDAIGEENVGGEGSEVFGEGWGDVGGQGWSWGHFSQSFPLIMAITYLTHQTSCVQLRYEHKTDAPDVD